MSRTTVRGVQVMRREDSKKFHQTTAHPYLVVNDGGRFLHACCATLERAEESAEGIRDWLRDNGFPEGP